MMGYKGPKDEGLMSSFIESNPAAGAKMGQFMSASQGFADGGLVIGQKTDLGGGVSLRPYTTSQGQQKYQVMGTDASNRFRKVFNSESEAQQFISSLGSTSSSPRQTTTTTATSTPQTNTSSTGGSQINNLFQQYLGRAPASDYYSNQLAQGRPISEIEAELKNSEEAKSYSQTSTQNPNAPTTPVQSPAQDNSGGYGNWKQGGYWTTNNQGTPTFVSPQGNPATPPANEQSAYQDVTRLFQSYAGRAPAIEGLNYYVGQLTGGRPLAEVEAEIARNSGVAPAEGSGTQTPAWQKETPTGGQGVSTQVGSVEQAEALGRIRDTFRSNLGRNIEQEGLDYYMQQVAAGRPLSDVLNEIIRSPESQQYGNEQWNQQQGAAQAQRDMATTAYTNPAGLTTQQTVAQLTPGEGTLIPEGTGQVTGTVGYDASTIDPTTGQAQAPEDIGTATYEAQQISDQLQGTLGDLEAQTATPSAEATVRGQLEILMDDFEDGTPPWASGAMRQATAIMQQRGLGASSMAGQAITQAALEAATNIAQQDAQTYATFELRNLDNRQQTAIFKAQQRITGLFTDQAAVNASRQFNASSENQTNQFMASLQESVSRFNASQVAAIAEINVNAENAAKQFNSQMTDMRERFNASNSLVISQANAQWRQNLNTINTAAQNDANRDYVKTVNAITTAALDQLWQRERDLMTFAFSGSESSLERELQMMLADKQEDLVKWQEGKAEDAAWGELLGSVVSKVLDW
jgi:hypothetical protein